MAFTFPSKQETFSHFTKLKKNKKIASNISKEKQTQYKLLENGCCAVKKKNSRILLGYHVSVLYIVSKVI